MGYCTNCGVPIPKGQRVCSVCYGDPFYGRDGYLLDYLNYMYEEATKEKELEKEFQAWEKASDEDESLWEKLVNNDSEEE